MNTIDITNPEAPINVTPFNQAAQARAFTEELKADIGRLNDKLLEGYRRRVWVALNYDNFVDYCQVELGESKSNAYRLLDAARVTSSLFPEFGKEATKLPVSHRELLLKLPADQRSATLIEAIHLAQLEGKKAPTANHVRRVIQEKLNLPTSKTSANLQDSEEEGEDREEDDQAIEELRADWERQAALIESLKAQLAQKDELIKNLQQEVLGLLGELGKEPPDEEEEGERWAVGDRVKILRIHGKRYESLIGREGEVVELSFTGLRIRVESQIVTCDAEDVLKLVEACK